MGADTVGHLKHLLETELKRAREENDLDIAMFSGVDGRIFSSSIPSQLDPREYRLLNLLKGNLAHICSQLSGQNMMMSVQQFEAGTVVISGVGDRAFLVFLTTKPVEITKMQGVLANVLKTSIVVRHLFESKPITPEILASYDEAVAGELKRLTRILFVEKFGETKEFKKNKEIAQYLQTKLGALVGPGPLQEIVTMAYNEVGTTALQHGGRGDAPDGHAHHGHRGGRRRFPVREATVLLRADDLPPALRGRPDEPRRSGRDERVQRERPQHRGVQFLRLPRTVPGGDREERDDRRQPAGLPPPRDPRLERRDEDLLQERRPGEHQRGPRPRPPAELRMRLRPRLAGRADQGRALRCPPRRGSRR